MDLAKLTDQDVEILVQENLFHPVADGLLWPNYRYIDPDFPPYAKAEGVWVPTWPIPEPAYNPETGEIGVAQ